MDLTRLLHAPYPIALESLGLAIPPSLLGRADEMIQ
jgi:hypothetical protein